MLLEDKLQGRLGVETVSLFIELAFLCHVGVELEDKLNKSKVATI